MTSFIWRPPSSKVDGIQINVVLKVYSTQMLLSVEILQMFNYIGIFLRIAKYFLFSQVLNIYVI